MFWALFLYCLAERLFEIWLSRRNRVQMQEKGFKQREGGGQLSIMVVMHSIWYVALLAETILYPTPLSATVVAVSTAIFLVTQLLRGWVLWTLGYHWNVSVMSSSSESPSFVSSGPYRFIRHPNYLVVIIELATLPLIGNAPCTALAFTLANAAVLFFRIRLEERYLFSIPGYTEAMSAKGRFLPTIRARS